MPFPPLISCGPALSGDCGFVSRGQDPPHPYRGVSRPCCACPSAQGMLSVCSWVGRDPRGTTRPFCCCTNAVARRALSCFLCSTCGSCVLCATHVSSPSRRRAPVRPPPSWGVSGLPPGVSDHGPGVGWPSGGSSAPVARTLSPQGNCVSCAFLASFFTLVSCVSMSPTTESILLTLFKFSASYSI